MVGETTAADFLRRGTKGSSSSSMATTSTTAKVSAARTALELAGDLNKNGDGAADGRSLAEMTPDQLASLIDRWEAERADMAKDVTAAQNDE